HERPLSEGPMTRILPLFIGLLFGWACASEPPGPELPTSDRSADESRHMTPHEAANARVLERKTEAASHSEQSEFNQGVYRIENGTHDLPEPRETGIEWSNGTAVGLRPPAVVEPPTRERRRMNIDQLQAAFIRVSDGLNWTERRGNTEVSLFEELSVTLGKPDFIQTTAEVLEPTALFQKFLDDAARQVCGKMVTRDGVTPTKVLLPPRGDEDMVDAHLAALVLRFHSRSLPEQSRDLAQWRWLYDTVAAVEASTETRWQTICVALFTHPDFYSY
ncbi:MAG: hypothetical protein VX589_13475, partial [Myxococcota bacterium]|nr:hypothetical protein [Myxococcota bacterium]